jgi:hypothetical protein
VSSRYHADLLRFSLPLVEVKACSLARFAVGHAGMLIGHYPAADSVRALAQMPREEIRNCGGSVGRQTVWDETRSKFSRYTIQGATLSCNVWDQKIA